MDSNRQQAGHGRHYEGHLAGRSGWLRAAVLGADDGLVSVSSIVIGVSASGAPAGLVLAGGIAGLVAGAMSMAAGEYVSVSAQRDVEAADRAREEAELAEDPEGELEELAALYRARGLPRALAQQVAEALHAVDPLEAHLRDEIGQQMETAARPWQAAGASAVSFLLGGIIPFLGLLVSGSFTRVVAIVVVTLMGLLVSGIMSARLAGTPLGRPTLRLVLGGGLAMLATGLVGRLVHLFIK
ncbi:VIT1/CCC1 transporter family protein [Sulfobacillus harzensis]|uniref:VIT family protein n=1 Tax=Sulfobacillus harzensis TaxID=2729629 RepID=A0A7Y0L9D4_9FIRM|nr:VIT family protein [Sulfobacillus harzensis]NMP24915.1 VIT family protein [Sulfobacillus harzensis]